MKKTLAITILFLSNAVLIFAQAKKYPLIEHFTNTKCGSCAANNPGFYAKTLPLINKSVHHVSYHPAFPYPTCALYQSNTAENSGRAAFYGVGFTPSFVLNGGDVQSVAALATTALNAEIAKTSPLQIKVKEKENWGMGTVSVKVELTALGAMPTGNYKLVAALCERTLNYDAPNGEKVHFDVFRKMLTAINGNTVSDISTPGSQKEFSFEYSWDSKWNNQLIYVLAWVVNADTKEVINSGSKFNDTSSAVEFEDADDILIYPNPAGQDLTIDISEMSFSEAKYDLLNSLGQVIRSGQISNHTEHVLLNNLSDGFFLVRINTGKGIFTKCILRN